MLNTLARKIAVSSAESMSSTRRFANIPALLIIEHNLKVVRAFSERVIVIDRGAKIAEGDAEQILNTPEVVTAYLGKRRG